MLLDARRFELSFSEGTLKKGLRLFEKKLSLLEKRPGPEYVFSVGDQELNLRKRGDKILSFHCTCRHQGFCEHLCATLFYFQPEALAAGTRKGKTFPGKTDPLLAAERRKKKQFAALQLWLEDQGEGELLDKKTLPEQLSRYDNLDPFTIWYARLQTLLLRYGKSGRLAQAELDDLTLKLDRLLQERKRTQANNSLQETIRLALMCASSAIFSRRLTGHEIRLLELLKKNRKALDMKFRNKLNAKERETWYVATMRSVDLDEQLISGAFIFLVPRVLSFLKDRGKLERLRQSLEKRRYRLPFPERFDPLLVARMQVGIREWRLFKQPFPNEDKESTELIMAYAELDLCAGRIQKAFQWLDKGLATLKTANSPAYLDFLDHVISKASESGDSEAEKEYLEESFIYGLFILPQRFDHYLGLYSPKEHKVVIGKLADKIRESNTRHSFDKFSFLLLKANRLDELLQEIRQQGNKFRLLHSIAMKKWPQYDRELLRLYTTQLTDQLVERKFYPYQQQVFDMAMEYINRLPADTAMELVTQVLKGLGPSGPFYHYVLEKYNRISLNEEG